ncbi:PREDICTED: probable WRKY transcription factor 14 isoform X2 [Ipomoea nil]|uniref:probable WRKY transcription factor 14 isoform X2 n=1 Tax=Ipomoea nil TaxID=35883 RepID=UPI000901FD5D|nr:PREDICTED: probable WRKY transcription factor 14 isoform X2 [Ipomoea nil]
MCSQFQLHGMENYQGDLADIVRGSGLAGNTAQEASPPAVPDTWQYPGSSGDNMAAAMNCYSSSSDHHDFGDPFCHLRDPLMFQELAMPPPPPPSAAFFTCSDNDLDLVDTAAAAPETGTSSSVFPPPKLVLDEEMKRPPACNIFSRMLQISPNSNLNPPAAGGGLACSENIISASSSGNAAGLQISSPRNTGSIKRRKSQAKKVVCVPAPAPANSRPSGEVVPSDLWAWRKYGQKPIKGSPYPRGYYRCSSSKGCSARKQVERSRTDPNMLVITYTSEHNHPWPTQRNALAGSTRAQAAKNAAAAATKSSISQTPTPPTTNDTPPVKEETTTAAEDRDGDDNPHHVMQMDEFPGGFPQSYKPALPSAGDNDDDVTTHHHHHPEDFFADLGEIESTDPLNLMFSQGFPSGQEKKAAAAGIAIDDAFNFYDWTTTTPTDNNNNSIQTLGKSDSGQRGL